MSGRMPNPLYVLTEKRFAYAVPMCKFIDSTLLLAISLRANTVRLQRDDSEELIRTYPAEKVIYNFINPVFWEAIRDELGQRAGILCTPGFFSWALSLTRAKNLDWQAGPRNGRFRLKILDRQVQIIMRFQPREYGSEIILRLVNSAPASPAVDLFFRSFTSGRSKDGRDD